MLLIDRLEQLEPGRFGIGVTDLSDHSGVFEGHFPGEPIMPGVLLVECMAQTAAVVFAPPPAEGRPAAPRYLARIERANFKRPVRPGETLRTRVSLVKQFGILLKVEAQIDAEAGPVADGALLLYDAEAQGAREDQ
jgi:3-hydroxymyristoyl/3-hydroxydecanoyl-(acyl carrier protein) dehydratase